MDEVIAYYVEEVSLYITVQNSDYAYLNSSLEFEERDNSHWSQYARALAESDDEPGKYVGDFPAVAEGKYIVRLYQRSGGSPATSDTCIHTAIMNWDGEQEIPFVMPSTGPYLLTLTVKDTNLVPIGNANVRVTGEDGFIAEGVSDTQGRVYLGVYAGDLTIIAAKFGYTNTPSEVTVTEDATETITLTQTFLTPSSDLAKCNCFTVARDALGNPIEGAIFEFDIIATPTDTTDSFSFASKKVTSGTGGLVEVELPRLARFQYRFGVRGLWKKFTVPNASTFQLPEVNDGK